MCSGMTCYETKATQTNILDNYIDNLMPYEIIESQRYDIYYVGFLDVKTKNYINNGSNNNGFDEKYYYKINKDDHLAYRYQILETLGKGAFSNVVKVYDFKDYNEKAIKIVKNESKFHSQVLNEIKILNILTQNPNEFLLTMTEEFTFRNHRCLVFDVLSMNLYELLKKNNHQGLDKPIVKNYAKQLCDGLAHLHSLKIIHCDLKPENILVTNSNSDKLVIIDFGSSTFENDTIYTYIQTRWYRAPEVILKYSQINCKIDMWSMGCIFYELLTGQALLRGKNEYIQICKMYDLLIRPEVEFIRKCDTFYLIIEGNRVKLSGTSRKKFLHKMDSLDNDSAKFLANFLVWEPYYRISAENALKLPWLN